MDRTDQLFHLQLAFQKLEEEVKLYRNGTTSENLLDLLHEKDREIVQLKGVVSETTDKLRRIAKGSSELIVRCENLQRERDAALKGEQLVNECLATQGSEMKLLQEEKASVFEALQRSIESITERDEKIKDLADQINKLQAQCASLVSKKSDLDRLLEKEKAERRETIKEFSAQLEKGIKFNMEMKERLRDEQASNVNVSSSLSEMTARLTRAEQTKHEIVSELECRISTLQSKLECSELKNQEVSKTNPQLLYHPHYTPPSVLRLTLPLALSL